MKDDILTCIKESIDLLEKIPVTSTEDCYRKVKIHDRLALAYNCLSKLKEENDGKDDTQTAD